MRDDPSRTAWPARAAWLERLVALLAIVAILAALWQLEAARQGIAIEQFEESGVPMTLYRPAGASPVALVVIAHGFAGSRQMMGAYAVTLARNGYLALTFDFPGHGRNTTPFVAHLEDQASRVRILSEALAHAVAAGQRRAGADARLALVGHSMAGDILVRLAASGTPPVAATVLVSPYLAEDAPTAAITNLLLVYGALEPALLHTQGARVLSESLGVEVEPDTTYGEPGQGSARRLALAPGVEHIGVLYSGAALGETLEWLDRTFAHESMGFVERRGPALALLYLGILALAWPLSRRLPRLVERPLGAGLPWRQLLPVVVAPSLLTPLLLWKVPSDLLPILLSDYLALHFAVYGLLTAVGVWIVRRRDGPVATAPVLVPGLARAALPSALYATLVFALPTHAYLTALVPGWERLPLVLAILIGTLLYFLADEWATRGQGAARGGYWASKLLFLLSLLLAVALNLAELFFLVIIVPAILMLFVLYGITSGWLQARTGHPAVAAIANAIAFASAMAVTFPLVAH